MEASNNILTFFIDTSFPARSQTGFPIGASIPSSCNAFLRNYTPFTILNPSPTNITPHHARSSTKKLSLRSKGVSFSSTPPATLACSVACGDQVASLEHLLRRAVGAAKSSYAGRAGHHPSSARRHLPTAHRATGRPAKGKG